MRRGPSNKDVYKDVDKDVNQDGDKVGDKDGDKDTIFDVYNALEFIICILTKVSLSLLGLFIFSFVTFHIIYMFWIDCDPLLLCHVFLANLSVSIFILYLTILITEINLELLSAISLFSLILFIQTWGIFIYIAYLDDIIFENIEEVQIRAIPNIRGPRLLNKLQPTFFT